MCRCLVRWCCWRQSVQEASESLTSLHGLDEAPAGADRTEIGSSPQSAEAQLDWHLSVVGGVKVCRRSPGPHVVGADQSQPLIEGIERHCSRDSESSRHSKGSVVSRVADSVLSTASSSSKPFWSIEQTIILCREGEEHCFEGKARLLERTAYTSVTAAVERLNKDLYICPCGICVVFSARLSMYNVVYRSDKNRAAHDLFRFKVVAEELDCSGSSDADFHHMPSTTSGASPTPRSSVSDSTSLQESSSVRSSIFSKLKTFVADCVGLSEQRFDPGKLVMTRCIALEDRYDILRELGAGAQGTTYEVCRKGTRTHSVAKLMKNKNDAGNQAFEEFAKMREFRHPNCVKVIELLDSPADSSLCIISELARGGDLYAYMAVAAADGGLTEELVSGIFYQSMSGVAFLHASGCIHSDLKPDNILMMESFCPGEVPRVVIGDYGCASSRTDHWLRFGDPRYQSPESVRKLAKFVEDPKMDLEPNEASGDVWAMGITLFELLSGGVIPFLYKACPRSFSNWDDPTWTEYRRRLLDNEAVQVVPYCAGVSAEAQAILNKMLQKDKRLRPNSQSVLADPWFSVKGHSFGRLPSLTIANLSFTASKNRARQILLNALAVKLEDEHKKNCYIIFDRFTSKNTGTIDRDEFREALAGLGQNIENSDQIFERADVAKTGSLEFNEFVALTYDWRSVDEATLSALLNEFMADLGVSGDGTFSADGLKTFFTGVLQPSELDELLQMGSSNDMREFVQSASFFGVP